MFDTCGAYDGVDGDRSTVEKGSEYPPWATALDFMEWFGA